MKPRFNIPADKQGQWVLKTFDYFEICKLCFASSCSLNKLLRANGHEEKTAEGKMAVEWAREGRWELIEEYCLQVCPKMMADKKLYRNTSF
jgi:hypothetical protein